jgi:hypothetical protein
MGDYQLAATELAMLHPKADRGIISRDYFHQRQHDLLGLMQVARHSYLRHRPRPPEASWTSEPSGFAHVPVVPAPLPPPGRHGHRRH